MTVRSTPTAPSIVGPPAALIGLTTYLLSQTARTMKHKLDEELARRGVRLRHMAVLAALDDSPSDRGPGVEGQTGAIGSFGQLDVGRRLQIDPSDMTAVVDELAALGHVRRAVDPVDRRRKVLRLTSSGASFLAELIRIAVVVQDELLSPLTPDRQVAFKADLAILGDHAVRGRPTRVSHPEPRTRGQETNDAKETRQNGIEIMDLPAGHPAWDIALSVLQELRPNLTGRSLAAVLEHSEAEGLRFAGVFDQQRRCLGVAGWRIVHNTSAGRKLYVDDLVITQSARSHGIGALILADLRERGRASGCGIIELDSGATKHGAHRFYLRERFDITAHHFSAAL